jgi:hypothetical protein
VRKPVQRLAVRSDDDPAEVALAELDNRSFAARVARGCSAAGQDGRRQDEHGNREHSGETHAIDLLHGFLSETLTLWP